MSKHNKVPFTELSYELIMRTIESTCLIPWIVRPWRNVPDMPGWHDTEIGDMHTNRGYGIMVRARETDSSLQVEMLGNGSPQEWSWKGEAFERAKRRVRVTDPNEISNFVIAPKS